MVFKAKFLDAASKGDVRSLKQLLALNKHNRDNFLKEACDESGKTALMMASEAGHTDVVSILLQKGADVNAQDIKGWTAVFYASLFMRVEIRIKQGQLLEELIKTGASINHTDSYGNSSLHLAAKFCNTYGVRTLLEKGANPKILNKDGQMPIHTVIVHGSANKVVEFLPFDCLEVKDSLGRTPLLLATLQGRLDIISTLISHGANVEAIGSGRDLEAVLLGKSPLRWAAHYGHTEIARVLLDNGANIENVDVNGWNALIESCFYGQLDIAKLLIGRGADTNVRCNCYGDNTTALHLAALKCNAQVVKELIGAGARLDAKDSRGKTPLDIAIEQEFDEVVQVLIQSSDTSACRLQTVRSGNLPSAPPLESEDHSGGAGLNTNSIIFCWIFSSCLFLTQFIVIFAKSKQRKK